MANEKPVRVAHNIGNATLGGVESVVYNYYRNIDKTQFQFDFIIHEGSPVGVPKDILAQGAREFWVASYKHPTKNIQDIRRLCRENKYKIFHSHLNTMSGLSLYAAKGAGVPVRICHIHSTVTWSEPKRDLLKTILRPTAKAFATHKAACGYQAGCWMYGKKQMDNNHVCLLPNAIDMDRFAYNPVVKSEIRQQLGIDEHCFLVGHIGRFTYAKNHIFLLEIFSELCKIQPRAKLLLVGDGELSHEIHQKVELLQLQDRVIFAGLRSDVHLIYSALDVFCMPSHFEGLPVVLVEAFGNNLGVVCSSAISKEVLEFPQVTMLDLDAGASAWAKAVYQKSRDCLVPMPQKIKDFYTISRQAVHLQEFYHKCLQEYNIV